MTSLLLLLLLAIFVHSLSTELNIAPYGVVSSGIMERTIDGNKNTCLLLETDTKGSWWSLKFQRHFPIHRVNITVRRDVFWQVKIGEHLCRVVSLINNDWKTESFDCGDFRGNEITFTNTTKNSYSVTEICEVEVYSATDTASNIAATGFVSTDALRRTIDGEKYTCEVLYTDPGYANWWGLTFHKQYTFRTVKTTALVHFESAFSSKVLVDGHVCGVMTLINDECSTKLVTEAIDCGGATGKTITFTALSNSTWQLNLICEIEVYDGTDSGNAEFSSVVVMTTIIMVVVVIIVAAIAFVRKCKKIAETRGKSNLHLPINAAAEMSSANITLSPRNVHTESHFYDEVNEDHGEPSLFTNRSEKVDKHGYLLPNASNTEKTIYLSILEEPSSSSVYYEEIKDDSRRQSLFTTYPTNRRKNENQPWMSAFRYGQR